MAKTRTLTDQTAFRRLLGHPLDTITLTLLRANPLVSSDFYQEEESNEHA